MQDTMQHARWVDPSPSNGEALALAKALKVPELAAKVLAARGFQDPGLAREFLSPSLAGLTGFQGLYGLFQAVDFLVGAIKSGKTIGVAGDYDADGLTASALLLEFLQKVGADTVWAVPNRFEEGYGFSPAIAGRLARAGAQVVITVDCGVADYKGLAEARALGLEVVVTDHHQVPDGPKPPAVAIINPQQKECSFCPHLAGVGVAFYLAAALRAGLKDAGWFKNRPLPNLRQCLDLVALGTCADVVPLQAENRVLVNEGLKVLAEGRRPGLAALLQVSRINGPPTDRDLGFALGPRLNAAGRLGDPSPALELLLAPAGEAARRAAQKLDALNQERRQIEDQVVAEALSELERDHAALSEPCHVLARPGWHKGVLGLVAGRVARATGRPALVLSIDNGTAAGSGRSVEGFDLYQALAANRELFSRFGGHAMAVGAALATKDLPRLAEALSRRAEELLGKEPAPPVLAIEAEASLPELSPAFTAFLESMSPFGQGNPEPLLVCRGARVEDTRVVGQSHLKMTLGQSGAQAQAIAFGMADRAPQPGQRLDLAFTPRMSNFMGRHLELVISDFRPA